MAKKPLNDRDVERVLRRVTPLRRARRFKEAAAMLTALFEGLGEDNPYADCVCLRLGFIYSEAGRFSTARRWLRRATRYNPTSELASVGLFHACWDLEDFGGAFREARRYLNLVPDSDYLGLRDMLIREGLV